MISATGPRLFPYSSQNPAREAPIMPPAAQPAAASSSQTPPPPSLESRMVEHKVAQAMSKKLETKVSVEDFENFKQFLTNHLHQRIIPGTESESSSAEFLNGCSLEKLLNCWECVFQSYKNIFPFYTHRKLKTMTKQELTSREKFLSSFWFISYFLSQICYRDMQTVALRDIPNYKRHYQEKIHPHFLVFQRLTNFLHMMLEKEGAVELLNPLSTLKIDGVPWVRPGYVGGMGFYRDNHGYCPIPFSYQTKEIESIYLFYGEDALPSEKNPYQTKVFLTQFSEFITQSGVIVDIGAQAEARQFLGMDTATPFLVGEVVIIRLNDKPQDEAVALPAAVEKSSQLAVELSSKGVLTPALLPSGNESSQANESESAIRQLQLVAARLMLSLIKGEIQKSKCDLYFVPMPAREIEKREFAYCQLQDLFIRSKNAAQPKAQRLALEWLQKIEAMENKPVETMLKELEDEIKADLRTQYQLEVEREQELRSQRVREGITEGLRKEKKSKKSKRREVAQNPVETPTSKRVDLRVEEAFQKFKVHGRIKYRNLVKVARQAMKEFPEAFDVPQNFNQRGSHQVLHLESGPATLVQVHGRKDTAVPKYYANPFLDELMKRVSTALQLK
ncbi:MAG: hypothetical protein LLG04_10505 [Parachlamydia sp.]|nr:hypothetical protein [Parachlamydia sp.]